MRKYYCPKCKCETFEEVSVDVTTSFRIKNTEDGPEYDEQISADGGHVDRIQCESCGHVILTAEGERIDVLEDLAPALEAIGAYRDKE